MSWANIHGHDAVRERLRRAHAQGRMAHAYLFCGPAGVGKKLFALELAKALFCERGGNTFTACDMCSSCHLVDARTHPDLQIVGRPEDKTEFPIQLMLDFCKELSLKPIRGHGRIAIVDDADDLNDESANSFLKTLEEPPPNALLILIATDPDRQMTTIRSRCQVIPFGSIGNDHVAAILQAKGVTDPALVQRLVRLAAGSPGLALQFAHSSLWATRDQLIAELLKPKPDSQSLAKMWMEQIESAAKAWKDREDTDAKESAIKRVEARRLLHLVIDLYRQALPFAAGTPPSHPEAAILSALAQKLGEDGLLEGMDRLLAAEMHNDRNVQLVLLVEGVVDALLLQAQAV
jgi:DNA polymerase-3 subunit delta'